MAAKSVTIMCKLIPMPVSIEVAVDKESSDARVVCIGTEEKPHEPSRVKQHMTCLYPTCDEDHSSHYGYDQRGTEVGDKLVVLSAEEIAAANGTPITGRKGEPLPELTFHHRDKTRPAIVAADSVQNIFPVKGAEKAYLALRNTLVANPEIVAVMIWSPGSAKTGKNALWTVDVHGDRLVATKQHWPETVRATVAVPEVPVPAAEQMMMDQLVTGSVEDFDLSVFSDSRKRKLDELVASRTSDAVSVVDVESAGPSPLDLLAGLQASLALVANKPKPAKRATVKKAAAKKAPAKKAAAKKAPARKKAAAA